MILEVLTAKRIVKMNWSPNLLNLIDLIVGLRTRQ